MIWTTRPRSEGAGDLWFFDQGTGPPLVLIHGVGLRAEAWLAVVPALAERFRVICVDMPGHGASPLLQAATLSDYVFRLSAFLAAIPGPVKVAGHSMGALLAVELAGHRPEQIEAVAALNTAFRRTPDAARAVQARAGALAEASAADPSPTLVRWFGSAPSGDMQDCAEACRGWLTQADAQGYAAAYRIFAYQDGPSDDALKRLACPALYLTGADDPNSTPAMAHALAAASPDGQAAIVENAAHMLPMTHPADVSRLLIRLFDAHTPSQPLQKGS